LYVDFVINIIFNKNYLASHIVGLFFYYCIVNVFAVIVAGGIGSRMDNAVPKQFLPLAGKPLMYYAIQNFLDAFEHVQIIVVMHPDYFSSFNEVRKHITTPCDIQLVAGGTTRFYSVQNGINAIANAGKKDIVLVHDAARPFAKPSLLKAIVDNVNNNGTTIPVVPVAESLRRVVQGHSETVDRSTIFRIQTPQAAHYGLIQEAFAQEFRETFTDEATVLEAAGNDIYTISGSEENIKITTPQDLRYAEWLMQNTVSNPNV
jgi:2-C-methyl-D-erythritol 4-phosphate cytidylyltransferase